jgi:hypothetical protein
MNYRAKLLLLALVILFTVLTVGHEINNYIESTFKHTELSSESVKSISADTFSGKLAKTYKRQATTPNKNQNTTVSSPKQIHKHATSRPRYSCVRPPLKNITTVKQTYIQEDGLQRNKVIKKYYELNTNLGEGYEAFLVELRTKLDGAFQKVETTLGITLNKTITLNMVFQTTRIDYEDYISSQGKSAVGNQGMYIPSKNLSIVEIKNHKQGIATAIHEATHAFSYAYWGDSVTFFSEGIAEYLESITLNGSIPPFDFLPIKHQQEPLRVSTLLFSEFDWHGDRNNELYQNSKALFYFLMSNQQGRKVILKIMQLETQEPCTTLSVREIEDVLAETYPNNEQEFLHWFSDNLFIFLNEKRWRSPPLL